MVGTISSQVIYRSGRLFGYVLLPLYFNCSRHGIFLYMFDHLTY
jgi:hypothetical protein